MRNNEDVEGFGIRSDSGFGNVMVNTPFDSDTGALTFLSQYISIKASGTKAVSFSLLSGLFNQGKFPNTCQNDN